MIGLHTDSWVNGARIQAYFGPVRVQAVTLEACLDALEAAVAERGGTDLVGMQIDVDPWLVPAWTGAGTATKLEALY